MQVDNLNMVIDQISKDKSIDRKVLHEALEQAILTAAKKVFGMTGNWKRFQRRIGPVGTVPVHGGRG